MTEPAVPATPSRADAPASACPFPYAGPDDLREPVTRALAGVVDPELALGIVDLGLVLSVDIDDARAHVRITMTTAACPVTGVIVADCETALDRVIPEDRRIEVEVAWDPPWSPDRVSERARRFLQG